jgi:hypothetical protein
MSGVSACRAGGLGSLLLCGSASIVGLALLWIAQQLIRLSQLNKPAVLSLAFRRWPVCEEIRMATLGFPAERAPQLVWACIGRDAEEVVMVAHVR